METWGIEVRCDPQIFTAGPYGHCPERANSIHHQLPLLQVKANSLRRKAAKSWLSVEAINASEGVLGVLLNKHGRRVIIQGAAGETTESPPPPPIPLFPTRDLEDPRLVAYIPHDRQSISSADLRDISNSS